MIEYPGNLGRREIRIDHQPCTLCDPRLLTLQPIANIGRPPILPDQGRSDGPARASLPYDRGFPLIRQTDCRNLLCLDPRVLESLRNLRFDRRDQSHRIMLDPARSRERWQDLGLALAHMLE